MSAAAAGFSLRRRLLLRLLGPLLALFAISGAGAYAFSLHYANSVYDQWLFDSANSLALDVQRGDVGPRLELSDSARRLFEWDATDITYFVVRGARSGIIGGRADLPAAPDERAPPRPVRTYNLRIDGRPARAVALNLPAERFGEAVSVEVAETTRKRHALAREILLGTLLPQALLIVVAGLLIWLGVRRGLAPLRDIAQQLSGRRYDRLEPIADDGVPNEVRPITHALNELLLRLDAALVARRRFIADAAHQLRTPLTALKLYIEQAQGETTLEGVRPVLAQLRISAERATRLSNQLLALARTEPEAAQTREFQRFDLCRLAQDAGAEWVPQALAKNIELSLSTAAPKILAWGDPLWLREALDNLLDNAVKYHPGGGAIAVGVDARPQPSVIISDDGPGIPAALRGKVFVRFHRGDHSSGVEGSGLGLAIVQEIVRAHGGQVSLGDGIGGAGLSVRLSLGDDAAPSTLIHDHR